jgi:hypothetical protein
MYIIPVKDILGRLELVPFGEHRTSHMHGNSCRVLITLEGFAIAKTSLEVAASSFTSIRANFVGHDMVVRPAPHQAER